MSPFCKFSNGGHHVRYTLVEEFETAVKFLGGPSGAKNERQIKAHTKKLSLNAWCPQKCLEVALWRCS